MMGNLVSKEVVRPMWGVDKARREAVRDWWQARKRGTKQQSMRPTLNRKTVKEEVTYDSKP